MDHGLVEHTPPPNLEQSLGQESECFRPETESDSNKRLNSWSPLQLLVLI